jgi:signal transduction histidine kinase
MNDPQTHIGAAGKSLRTSWISGRKFNPIYTVMVAATVLILSLWASLQIYMDFEKKNAYQDAERLVSNFARTFEEHTVRTIRVLDQTTMFVKREFETTVERLDLEAYGRDGAFIDQFYNLIAVVDTDGWVRKVNRPLPPSNVSDREHFQVHVAEDTKKLFISKPVLGRSSGKWSMQFTRRINKADGSFGGIVVTSLDPYYFTEFYRTVEIGPGSVAALVGTDGIVRARRTENSSEIGQDISNSSLFKELAKASSSSGNYFSEDQVDGIHRMYSYRKLKDYPLVVVVGIEERAIIAEYNEHLNILNALGGFIALLIMVAAASVIILLRNQQRVQDSLLASQEEAVSANRMKSEFLARMSHELRTPLTGVLGFSEYLKDSAKDSEDREVAETIHGAGMHLLSLVNATLDLAKIEAGKMEINLRPENLSSLVHRVVTLHQSAAVKKQIDVKVDFDTNLPMMVECDATKLVQVLNNLIHNAIKFTDRGSVTISVVQEDKYIGFAVADTGPGIAPESQALLFDRFRQLDSFSNRAHEGSGLGLALAKELVELMGGRIWIDPKLGIGSTFHFTLPVKKS